MQSRWTVGSLSTVCFALWFPAVVNGQQNLDSSWQGVNPYSPFFQSPTDPPSSPQPAIIPTAQHPALKNGDQRPSILRQPGTSPAKQQTDKPQVQEIPAREPQERAPARVAQPAVQTNQQQNITPDTAPVPATVNVPGYLGANTRDFYRERFCMHALTIQGVEVETLIPNSPAAQAGLRPARQLTTREIAVASVAGLLTLTPAAAAAPTFVRFSGGVSHGDIILAVNGRRVKTQSEFQSELLRTRPQTTAYLTVHRDGANTQVPVHLSEWPPTTTYVYLR